MKESRAPGGAERIKLKAARVFCKSGHIYKVASQLPPTPNQHLHLTSMVALAGGASWKVYTHMYTPASSPLGLLSLQRGKRRHLTRRAANGRRRTLTDLYSAFLLDMRVSGISSPFFIQKLSWWTPCALVRLHCSTRTSPSTGSRACSEALIIDSAKERRINRWGSDALWVQTETSFRTRG